MKRNETCLCGSGKKYKHCCAAAKPAEIHQLVEGDFFELQQDIYDFSTNNYEEEINGCINDVFGEVFIEDEEQFERAGFLLVLWVIFSLPIAENGQTILETYIKKRSKRIKRPALKEAIINWQSAVPSIYKVIKDEQDVIEVVDIFTNEAKHIQVGGLSDENRTLSIEGSYVMGTVIEYRNRAFFFATFYPINNPVIIEEVKGLYNLHASEFTPQKFLDEFYPEVVELVFGTPFSLEDIPWDTDQQKQVIELVRAKLNYPKDVLKPIEGIAVTLWKIYCEKTGANIRSISNYAAALHYHASFFSLFFGEDEISKDELTKLYNVKRRALTDTINKLDEILEDDIDQMIDEMTFGFEDDEFDDEDDDDFVFGFGDDFDEDDEDEFDDDDFEVDFDSLFLEETTSKPIIDELAKKRAEKQKLKK
ncbi:SEC-C domain-containing protein [Anaerobacillus sp. CMMVII]|uniref:SEC-C domain-containing protein n=1 Tax=Anaerobacillus sp. CMMVII TaxID=2755588 RepID=UPI0021B7E2C7|nr:SEC-C domain-containing protein [Anaerobacillus sp. CMMVII]MCT8136809.1 SEC-C domain-containing protein [Anaerobacillus sp. CMMVII]